MSAFYVYEHRRADTGAVFYVGKGSGYRATVAQHKGRWWNAIVAKAGLEVRRVADGLSEELAFLAEAELIDKHRRLGTALVNQTDGGGGMSGYKFSAECVAARAAKQRGQKRPTVSAKLKGRPKTPEHRAAQAAAHRGYKHTDEAKAKMVAARKLRPGSPNLGKTRTAESKRKTTESLLAFYAAKREVK